MSPGVRAARFTLVASFASALAACGGSPKPEPIAPRSPPAVFEPPKAYAPIDWIESFEEARARARDEHKPMILFVRAAWAKASIDMEQTIWGDARVLAEAGRFIPLRVDLTDSYGKRIPKTLEPYTIESIPTTLLFDSGGNVVARFEAGVARAKDVAMAMHEAK